MEALSFAATKIQPPRWRNTRLLRPALEAALGQAIGQARVVLLQAPAGFGKTSALASQLARLPAGTALAWVSLDEDDDPARLFTCLSTALEAFDLPWRTAPEALAGLLADDGDGSRRALAELVNALAGADCAQGVIVLDDLHRVDHGGVFRLLDQLIERLPPRWTLVLSSRVAPPLPLNRLHVSGELVVFDQDRLRFSADEAQALAAAEGTPERAADLFERTQGWPAGLRLCLAALRTRPGGAPGAGALRDRHLYDFLASEVLDDMPLALHDFLLRCSVLPELTAARAAAVSGDARAAERLDEIERRGLFVTTLEAQERTLVLHDLFRDALQDRLRRRWPGELPALLKRAAAGESDPMRRVGFLLRAQDWYGAETALADAAPDLLLQGGVRELERLIGQFDEAWRQASPRLLCLAGLACFLRWDWQPMARHFEAAVKAAGKRGDNAALHEAQAYLAAALYPLDRNAEAEALIAQLKELPLDPHARMLTLMADCSQHLRRGQLQQVATLYGEVLDLLQAHGHLFNWWECVPAFNWTTLPGMAPALQRYFDGVFDRIGGRPLSMRGEVHVLRAFTLLWAGRLDEARAEVGIAEADRKWLAGSGEMEIGIELFHLVDGALQGRADVVAARLQTLLHREDTAADERRRLWQHHMAIYGVRMNDVLGAGAEVLRDWAALLKENPIESNEAQNARATAVRARYAAAQGRWADAADLFSRLLPKLLDLDVMGHAMDLRLRTAHALLRCGCLDDAAQALQPALQRLQHEGVRGQALLAGPVVLATLAEAGWGRRLAPDLLDELKAVADLAARVRSSAARHAPAPTAAPAQPGDGLLSEREREVLEFMAAGDSNKHIARALDISPHTVKRHVANILDKLGVASRGQASAWWRDRAPLVQGAR